MVSRKLGRPPSAKNHSITSNAIISKGMCRLLQGLVHGHPHTSVKNLSYHLLQKKVKESDKLVKNI